MFHSFIQYIYVKPLYVLENYAVLRTLRLFIKVNDPCLNRIGIKTSQVGLKKQPWWKMWLLLSLHFNLLLLNFLVL